MLGPGRCRDHKTLKDLVVAIWHVFQEPMSYVQSCVQPMITRNFDRRRLLESTGQPGQPIRMPSGLKPHFTVQQQVTDVCKAPCGRV